MSDDDAIDPTPEELAEAEALAHALERGTERGPLPGEALETAAFLRYAGGATLPEARKRAIFDELASGHERKLAQAAHRAPDKKRSLLAWLGVLVPALALVAVLLFVILPDAEAPVARPNPPVALLEAQLAASRGDAEARETLAREMRSYRRVLVASIEQRYEGSAR